MSESQSNPASPQAVTADSLKLSMESIIDKVRCHRNDLIKDLLKDGKIQSYFLTTHQKTISPVRIEFIRRELKNANDDTSGPYSLRSFDQGYPKK